MQSRNFIIHHIERVELRAYLLKHGDANGLCHLRVVNQGQAYLVPRQNEKHQVAVRKQQARTANLLRFLMLPSVHHCVDTTSAHRGFSTRFGLLPLQHQGMQSNQGPKGNMHVKEKDWWDALAFKYGCSRATCLRSYGAQPSSIVLQRDRFRDCLPFAKAKATTQTSS